MFSAVYDLSAPKTTLSYSEERIEIVKRKMALFINGAGSMGCSEKASVLHRHMQSLWGAVDDNSPETALFDGEKADALCESNWNELRKRGFYGYYGPGVAEHGGLIYPPGRLHHLERILRGKGLCSDPNTPLLFFKEFEKTTGLADVKPNAKRFLGSSAPVVKVFYSFRSPYSQLVLPRLAKMCDFFGAKIEVYPMMPMVMRGLKVPREKEHYIGRDIKREAELWSIPFLGLHADPGMPLYCIL
jgi:hypothetical protein